MLPLSDHQISLIPQRLRLEEQPMTNEGFPRQQDAITNFEPSLVVVIGILAIVFALTILLLLYFKFCHSNAATSTVASGDQLDEGRPSVFLSPDANVNTPSGLDKKAIQSLPFFRFGVLRGAKEGLECSVCLSKYQDAEILRLLPKCRHAFHVDCIDQWLSHHSTCPLCRSEVAITDAFSNLGDAEDSISNGNFSTSASIANDEGVELFVEREKEDARDRESAIPRSSSVFCISSSFRRVFAREGQIPVSLRPGGTGDRVLHKHNHKIVFSDVVFKNRWSNVSSSDLRFLNSEILISCDQFSNRDLAGSIAVTEMFQSIGEESDCKNPNSIELAKRDSNVSSASPTRALLNSIGAGDSSLVEGRRSVSEITQYSRFKDVGWLNYGEREDPVTSAVGGGGGGRAEKEGEIKRKIWFPIARKTVERFATGRREESESKRNQNCGLNFV